MTVDVLMLMEITSVFVFMDLMVQNVKVTKTQWSCFMMECMPPYVLSDVQWCSKKCALKLLLATSGLPNIKRFILPMKL
jgi:hypothetical protein